MGLTNEDLERYSRQIILPLVGGRGQMQWAKSRVLVIGCGGLGCPLAMGLAGAGVGHIDLVDPDHVALSNLHRQIAYTEEDIGALKAEVLAARLKRSAPIKAVPYTVRADAHNLPSLMQSVDLVIDGSDNFGTRFAVADACVQAEKPLISGAVSGHSGQLFAQPAAGQPCYRCLFEEVPSESGGCDADGVLPGATLTVAGMMVQWSLLALLEHEDLPQGILMQGNLISGLWRPLTVPARQDCICAQD